MSIRSIKSLSRKLLLCASIVSLIACGGAPKKVVEAPPKPDPKKLKPVLLPEHQTKYQQAVQAVKAGNHDIAAQAFNDLLALYPTLAGAHVNLGLIQQQKGNVDDAIVEYRRALDINPGNAEALFLIGLHHMQKGEFGQAETLFLQADSVNPRIPQLQFNLGVLYELYLQEYDEAIDHYEQYIALGQGNDIETVKRWVKLLERK